MERFDDIFLNQLLEDNPFKDLKMNFGKQLSKIEVKVGPKKSTKTQQWSIPENKIYLKYLIDYKQDFKDEEIRRKSKVFKRMSEEMGKIRTPQQCRGHHKKLAIKYESLDEIITATRKKIKKNEAKEKKQRMGNQWQQQALEFKQIHYSTNDFMEKNSDDIEKAYQALFGSFSQEQEHSPYWDFQNHYFEA